MWARPTLSLTDEDVQETDRRTDLPFMGLGELNAMERLESELSVTEMEQGR